MKRIYFIAIIFLLLLTILFAINLNVRANDGTHISEETFIIKSGELEKTNIPDNSHIVLAVDENIAKANGYTVMDESINALEISETEQTELISELEEQKKEKQEKDNKFLSIFKKYYGDTETEKLLTEINNEIENTSSDHYIFPENSGKTLLTAILNMINSEEIPNNEKEILKNAIKEIDIDTLNDETLKETINTL